MKKTVVSLALGMLTVLAHAQEMDYFLVVPNQGKYIPASGEEGENGEDTLSITLTNSVPPPAAVINTPYEHDLSSLLQVVGDPSFQASEVLWSVVSGSLPDGLTLSPGGVLAGTPTIKDTSGTTVELQAVYKTESATQVFTLYVNGLVLQATKVFAGSEHSCALTPAGGVKCWGNNRDGQVGLIDPEYPDELSWRNGNATTPIQVQGLDSGVVDLAVGQSTSCAILMGGVARCWGWVPYYSDWHGSVMWHATPWPSAIIGLPASGIKKIAIGGQYAYRLALTEDGKLYGWWGHDVLEAVELTQFGDGIVDIAVSRYTQCALYADGSAKCMGRGSSGQIGNGLSEDRELSEGSSPALVQLNNIVSISAGDGEHICAVVAAGDAYCWGANSSGELGDGTLIDRSTPQKVQNLTGVREIAPGGYNTCALEQGGAVKCWGSADVGALGNGIDDWQYMAKSPEGVIGLESGVVSISAGTLHGCAVKQSGETVCWGWNSEGQLGDGTTTNSPLVVETLPY